MKCDQGILNEVKNQIKISNEIYQILDEKLS